MRPSHESRTLLSLAVLALALSFNTTRSFAEPVVPGFNVDLYADVPDPQRITFAPDGTMFVGRDIDSGGVTPTKIHRVGAGGGPVTEYGISTIGDPDSVLFDATGSISGTAGAVLVGRTSNSGGILSAILPDESIITLFGPPASFVNPSDMLFDSTGRLLIADLDGNSRTVSESTGAFPTVLFTLPTSVDRPLDMAIDSLDRIYTRGDNGVIRQYDSSGALLDASYASVATSAEDAKGMDFGVGGLWGTDIYAAGGAGGLWKIDSLGSTTLLGSGFDNVSDFKFGPDGELYVGEYVKDRVLRVSAVDSPSNASFDTAFDVDVLNLDFGTVNLGSSPADLAFDIANLLGVGTTANLSLTNIDGSGDLGALTTDLATFTGLDALGGGDSSSFASSFDTNTPGTFGASYELSFTDTLGTDQTLTLNLSGVVEIVDDPAIPDLIYNAATGEVILDPDASAIIGYTLQNDSNGFLPGGFTPILGGVSTALTSELAEAALSPGAGSIGFVFPAGMDITDLFEFLSVNTVSTGLGAPLVPFDLIVIGSPVPEPSTYAMAAMGLIGLIVHRRLRRTTSRVPQESSF